jgi:probable F420-dependent oxidoreductase
MDIGVLLPHVGNNASATAMRDVAQAGEELGFASLWTADHVAIPKVYDPKYPFNSEGRFPIPGDRPFLEFFQSLAFAAAVTRRVKLGVSVAIVPYRHPVYLAKSVSTLDMLSEGRFIFGVGVGWMKEEFEALGQDFRKRGRLTDETLEFLRAAWSADQPVTFKGEFIDIEEVFISPQPRGNGVEMWVGGLSDVALERTARYGSAWQPHLYGAEPSLIRSNLESLNARAGELRPGARISATMFIPIEIMDVDEPQPQPWECRILRGTTDYITQSLRTFEESGVDHVLLAYGGKVSDKLKIMQRLSDEVLPAFR